MWLCDGVSSSYTSFSSSFLRNMLKDEEMERYPIKIKSSESYGLILDSRGEGVQEYEIFKLLFPL